MKLILAQSQSAACSQKDRATYARLGDNFITLADQL